MKVSDETKTNVSCFLGVVGLIGIFSGLVAADGGQLSGGITSAIIGLSSCCLGVAMSIYPED